MHHNDELERRQLQMIHLNGEFEDSKLVMYMLTSRIQIQKQLRVPMHIYARVHVIDHDRELRHS